MPMQNRLTFCCTIGLLALCWLLPPSSRAQVLQTVVDASIQGQTWAYNLHNLEPAGSSNWLTSFYLPIGAPVSDIQAPDNWSIDSDSSSYILWSNQEAYPYPHDVAPGLTLAGFQFTASAPAGQSMSLVSSWDHDIDDSGPAAKLSVLAPMSVPEPASIAFTATGTLMLLAFTCRRSR